MFLTKKGKKKHPYVPLSIAQKMLAYETQHLSKLEQKSAMYWQNIFIYIHSIGLHILSVSFCISEEV